MGWLRIIKKVFSSSDTINKGTNKSSNKNIATENNFSIKNSDGGYLILFNRILKRLDDIDDDIQNITSKLDYLYEMVSK